MPVFWLIKSFYCVFVELLQGLVSSYNIDLFETGAFGEEEGFLRVHEDVVKVGLPVTVVGRVAEQEGHDFLKTA